MPVRMVGCLKAFCEVRLGDCQETGMSRHGIAALLAGVSNRIEAVAKRTLPHFHKGNST